MPHQGVMQGMIVLAMLLDMDVVGVLHMGCMSGCLPGNNSLHPGNNRTDKHHQQGETAKPVCQRKEKPIMHNKILPAQIWRNSHALRPVFQCDTRLESSFHAIPLILRKNNHRTEQKHTFSTNFYKIIAINNKRH